MSHHETKEEALLRRIIISVGVDTDGDLNNETISFLNELTSSTKDMIEDYIHERVYTYVADTTDEEPIQ